MEYSKIKETLKSLSDEEYRKFHSNLCPTKLMITGVRIPDIKILAKKIAIEDYKDFLKNAKDNTYEEVMLQALVIGYAKDDIQTILNYIRWFVPKIDNWAICDCFCGSLKITNKNKEIMWNFIQDYLASENEFEVRFGLIMIKSYYIKEEYVGKVFDILNKISSDKYYVKMAVAWNICECYIKYPNETMQLLKENTIDDFTYNKALQKIVESCRINNEEKYIIRKMKRKK